MSDADRYDPLTPEEQEAELDARNPGAGMPDWQRSNTPRNLTPDEVETLLGALENLIAITSMVNPEGFTDPWDWNTFVEHRDMAGLVWSRAIATIDGGDDSYGDPDEYSND